MQRVAFEVAVARVRAALAARPPVALDPAAPHWPAPLRRAAVAVLLRDHDGEAVVPMIVRGDDAPVHASQTALPGGRWEARDGSLVGTALREVEEEVGVTAARVTLLGELDDVPTRTGYLIRPVVGVLDAARFTPDPREVVEVFEVPLGAFVDPTVAEDLGVREVGTIRYPLRAYDVGGRRIWGVAARVLELVAATAVAG